MSRRSTRSLPPESPGAAWLSRCRTEDLHTAARGLGLDDDGRDRSLRRAIAAAHEDRDRLLSRVEALPRDARDLLFLCCLRGYGRTSDSELDLFTGFLGFDAPRVRAAESVLRAACLLSPASSSRDATLPPGLCERLTWRAHA